MAPLWLIVNSKVWDKSCHRDLLSEKIDFTRWIRKQNQWAFTFAFCVWKTEVKCPLLKKLLGGEVLIPPVPPHVSTDGGGDGRGGGIAGWGDTLHAGKLVFNHAAAYQDRPERCLQVIPYLACFYSSVSIFTDCQHMEFIASLFLCITETQPRTTQTFQNTVHYCLAHKAGKENSTTAPV